MRTASLYPALQEKKTLIYQKLRKKHELQQIRDFIVTARVMQADELLMMRRTNVTKLLIQCSDPFTKQREDTCSSDVRYGTGSATRSSRFTTPDDDTWCVLCDPACSKPNIVSKSKKKTSSCSFCIRSRLLTREKEKPRHDRASVTQHDAPRWVGGCFCYSVHLPTTSWRCQSAKHTKHTPW